MLHPRPESGLACTRSAQNARRYSGYRPKCCAPPADKCAAAAAARCSTPWPALPRIRARFPAGESAISTWRARADEILESAVPPPEPPGTVQRPTPTIIEFEDFESRDGDFARLQVIEKCVALPKTADERTARTTGTGPAGTGTRPRRPASGARLGRWLDGVHFAAGRVGPRLHRARHSPRPPARAASPASRRDHPHRLLGAAGAATSRFPSTCAGKCCPASRTARCGPSAAICRDAHRHRAGRRSDRLWWGLAVPAGLAAGRPVDSRQPRLARRPCAAARSRCTGCTPRSASRCPRPPISRPYQLRQWGVTGDPSANGTLRVRASILNTAAQLQPYPLLRVTLANRFGTSSACAISSPPNTWASPSCACSRPGNAPTRRSTSSTRERTPKGSRSTCACAARIKRVSCAGDAAAQAKQPGGAN